MDFGELTIDSLIGNGALSSANPEMDLRKIRSLSPQSNIQKGSTPNFPIMVANGQLQTPNGTIELKFEVGDIEFHKISIVMENLTDLLLDYGSFRGVIQFWRWDKAFTLPIFFDAAQDSWSSVL